MPDNFVAGNRKEFKDRVLAHARIHPETAGYVVDFAGTSYIDSSGLGVLTSLSKKLRETGKTLAVANLNDDLTMLFQLTGLDTLFAIESAPAPPPPPPSSRAHLRRIK